MKDKIYFIDETVFEKDTELLKGNFGKDYFLNIIDGGREAKVFVYQLSKFLISEKFPLLGTDETINGKDYIPIYSENYFKGKEYFLNNFSVTSDTIFKNPDPYIKNLHYCYYHAEPISGKNGWEYYEHSYPNIINKKTIADYGFFAGILFEFKQLQKKYSTLFKDFEKNCPLELPVKKKAYTAPDFALFCSIVNQCNIIEYDHKAKDDYCKLVSEYFNLVCPLNTRKEFSARMDIKKTDVHLKKVIDLILPQIHNRTEREKILQYINNKTKMYT